MLAEATGNNPKKDGTDENGNVHGGTLKVDATCCDAEVRYPTDSNLLEDGSRLIDCLLDKFCSRRGAQKLRTHRMAALHVFFLPTKKTWRERNLLKSPTWYRYVACKLIS